MDNAEKVGLPIRPFLYTLDQVATLLAIDQVALEQVHVHFDGRTTGKQSKDMMLARNVAPPRKRPEWRIAERELLRYLRRRGIRFYERGYAES